jgi:hypothetical protein
MGCDWNCEPQRNPGLKPWGFAGLAAKPLKIIAQGFYEAELVKSAVKKAYFRFWSSFASEFSDTSAVTARRSGALPSSVEGLIVQVGKLLFWWITVGGSSLAL